MIIRKRISFGIFPNVSARAILVILKKRYTIILRANTDFRTKFSALFQEKYRFWSALNTVLEFLPFRDHKGDHKECQILDPKIPNFEN